MMQYPISRRIIVSTLATGAIAGACRSANLFNSALAATCGSPTRAQTAGPFYRPQTPRRSDFRADGAGAPFLLSGNVFGDDCQPLANAVVDIWHADNDGRYDNAGFKFRGHQLTDNQGQFAFSTIIPGNYGNRTRHIHVKAQGQGTALLTTQLYFPDDPLNATDGIFDPALIMDMGPDGLTAGFDLVLSA